jgi:hypothetical protein
MFLGSISFVLNTLSVSGRDGIVLYILSFIFSYLLFENYLSQGLKKRILKTSIIILLIFGIFFAIITLERFTYAKNADLNFALQVGVLNYFSMQPFTFNDVIKYQDTFSYGRGSFPLFYSWFFDFQETERDVSMAYKYNFAGYVGSFYKNGGFLALTIIISIFYLLFTRIKYMHRKYYIYQFSLSSLYCLYITSGLFYFRLGNKGGNLFILLSIIMLFIFKRKIVLDNSLSN